MSISSCKKKDDNNGTGRSTQIVGTWKQTQTGDDDNSNGIWDASEKSNVASADALTLVFNSNGTGSASQSVSGFPLSGTTQWSLKNNDNDLQVIVNIPTLSLIDTQYYNILSFTNTEVTVKDTVAPFTFDTFTKQ